VYCKETLLFLTHANGLLIEQTTYSYLDIYGSELPLGAPGASVDLSRAEQDLVYQLIHTEYRGVLQATPRPGYIQLTRYDKVKETDRRGNYNYRVQQRINRQTGVRWLIEAMIRGSLESLSCIDCASKSGTDAENAAANAKIEKRLEKVKAAIKNKCTVLVGHNIFTDLVYLYHCFIGALPATIEGFQTTIHAHFPFIVDTKYMATYRCGAGSIKSSLLEVHERLKIVEKPSISISHLCR
jgi:poly(A)-specific ribonuclease